MKIISRIFVITILLVTMLVPLSAKANDSMAIGVQAGFLATGAVIDIPLGPIAVNAGVNFPAGWYYIKTLANEQESLEGLIDPYFVVTADVTAPIPMGDNFDLKIGINTLAFTDFTSGMFGVAGATIKGEYWIPNKNTGLFVNLNAPVMVYIVSEDTPFNAVVSPWLPLVGIVTTTAGVLWAF